MPRGWSLLVAGLAALSACHRPGVLSADGPRALPFSSIRTESNVELSAAVDWLPSGRFRVSIYVRNLDPDTARVEAGDCPVRLRAYSSSALSEPAIWDDHWPADQQVVCPDVLLRMAIGPGHTATIHDDVGALAEAWPPPLDAYYGVVVVENGRRRLLDAGRVRM